MNNIIKEARELYNQTIKDPAYSKSQIWNDQSGNHHDLMRIINTCETPEEVIEELRKTDMYAIRIHDQKTFELMMKWHEDAFYKERGVVKDTELLLAKTPNLMKMLFYCHHIKNYTNGIKSIIELGGGNGQFAYIAKHILKNELHIDIDIPESLYMAYVCTRYRLPNLKCYWINQRIEVPEDCDFYFIPVGRESVLEKQNYDLFVNTASMGELPNDKIRYWMDFVQNKINVDMFYGFNRFLNTILPNETQGFSASRKNENEASVLFDEKWRVLHWEVEPLMARCPYEDPKIARYLEIILERLPEKEYPYSNEYMAKIEMQDWWRYQNVDCLGTHRSNQLVNDFTMEGTLFTLWNAIRLGDKRAVPLILQYFKHIGRSDTAFEEEFFYRKLISI